MIDVDNWHYVYQNFARSSEEVAMQVGDVLRKKSARVATIRMNETVAIAAQLMRSSNISALVVKDVVRTEGNTAVGMFTERDVVRAIAEHGAAGVNLKVSQLISVQQLVSCSVDRHARTCSPPHEPAPHPSPAGDRQLQPDRRRQHPRHLVRVRRGSQRIAGHFGLTFVESLKLQRAGPKTACAPVLP